MAVAALISVDWGTTSLRCALLDANGAILSRRDDGPGIQPPPRDGFAAILRNQVQPWQSDHGPLPILMSGMIGSRQGWVEVPYLACPAGPDDLAAALHRIDTGSSGTIDVVPGLSMISPGTPPEVMRGEEAQIAGALASPSPAAAAGEHLFVLPGTHSKWAHTSGSRITSFATFMTGEVFAAMRRHTILGRLMPDEPTPFDPGGFAQGVAAGALPGHPGDLLARLFSTRTLGLFERLPAMSLESYLSGLLIGAEMAAATSASGRPALPVTIIASATLAERYIQAAQILRIQAARAPDDCAPRGHWLIARAANLIRS